MKLSILIVNWNTRELVVNCINSVFTHPPKADFEIIVVDNASSDGSLENLRSNFGHNEKVKIIASAKNLGFGRGNNLAYQDSSGEYVFLLNPDSQVTDSTLDTLIVYMDAHPDVGIVGPKIVYPGGNLQPSVRRFPTIWPSVLVFSGLHRIIKPRSYLMDDFDYQYVREVDQVMGAALFTRRSVIEQIGFFDENFWLWYEEVDFCKRVKDAGQKVMFTPKAIIEHHSGKSFSQLSVYQRKKIVSESLLYYFRKHGSVFDSLLLRLILPVVLLSALLVDKFSSLMQVKIRPHA